MTYNVFSGTLNLTQSTITQKQWGSYVFQGGSKPITRANFFPDEYIKKSQKHRALGIRVFRVSV